LLRALLALQQAVLRCQQALLLALRPRAFRLLRLQLLYALLQAIDAVLALPGLAGKHLALPLLCDLLALLNMLFALLRALLLWRRPLAHGRRRAWPRWGGDMRRRTGSHRWPLRRVMEFGPWRCDVWRGRARRRRGNTRWRVRRHGRSLRR
jgi:hypothetical protein